MAIRCLVEASRGIGDVMQATPLCRALWLLGMEVDVFLNGATTARAMGPLLGGHPAIRRVLLDPAAVDFRSYDCGVSAYGDRLALRHIAPGFCRDVGVRDIMRLGQGAANLEPARDLGYVGPVPPSIAIAGARPVRRTPKETVVVHAGSDPSDRRKRWSGWAEICARLERREYHVVLVGTESDRSDVGWEDHYDRRLGLPLVDVVALLREAVLYLGNDSGVGHLAAAAGTPGVVAFGPTDATVYAPNSRVLRLVAAPARVGEGLHPGEPRRVPIDRLDVDTVWEEIEGVLADPRRDPPRVLPARRVDARGNPDGALPTPREIGAVVATLDGTDALLRRLWASAVLGLVARDGDRAAAQAWRREVGQAAGLAYLRAAEARRIDRTWRSHRKALRNLYLAWRAGERVRAIAGGVSLLATRRSQGVMWNDIRRD